MREYLKTLRIEKGLTQQEVASKLCISLSYYNLIENGERLEKMSIDFVSKLSDVLGVDLNKLILLEKTYSA